MTREAALTFYRPENGKIDAVGDGGGASVAGLPQTGPVPSHLHDTGATLAANGRDLPELHGHGACHKDPAQHVEEEAKYLHYADIHPKGFFSSSFFSRGPIVVTCAWWTSQLL